MPGTGGETAKEPSGWTVDTGLNHVLALMAEKDTRDQQRFDAQQLALRDALLAQEKAVSAALAAADRAVTKAEEAATKRFDSVNEFRGQLADQAREFMPRREAEQALENLRERVGGIDRKQGDVAARQVGGDKVWAYVLGAAGFVIGFVGTVTRFA